MTAAPGLFQIPGCDPYFDWSPGPAACCGAAAFAVIDYASAKGDRTTAIVCPRCRLLTLQQQIRRVWFLGSFDLLTGEYRPHGHPEPANSGDLLRFFPDPAP